MIEETECVLVKSECELTEGNSCRSNDDFLDLVDDEYPELSFKFYDDTSDDSWVNASDTAVFTFNYDQDQEPENITYRWSMFTLFLNDVRPDEYEWNYYDVDGKRIVVFRLWWD